MFRNSSLLVACAALLILSPDTAAAQDAGVQAAAPTADVQPVATSSATPRVTTTAPSVTGPTVAASVVGVRVTAESPLTRPAVAVQRVNRNPALMIVGGTALIVGGIIGGDAGTIIMVGGAVIGLVGLWNFLR